MARDMHVIPAEILRRTRRGVRAGRRLYEKQCCFRPAVPSIVMGNVRSLPKNSEELAAPTRYQREYRDASVIIFSESWLTLNISDSTVDIDHFHLVRADRTAESG